MHLSHAGCTGGQLAELSQLATATVYQPDKKKVGLHSARRKVIDYVMSYITRA